MKVKDPNAVSLGLRGGASTKKKYGKEHYQEIGRKGGQKKKKKSSPTSK